MVWFMSMTPFLFNSLWLWNKELTAPKEPACPLHSSPYFFSYYLELLQLSAICPSTSLLCVPKSCLSDPIGTTCTWSSADVSMNHTKGLVVLWLHDLHHTPTISSSYPPMNLWTPACSATLERATTPWERSLAASSISMRAWGPSCPMA